MTIQTGGTVDSTGTMTIEQALALDTVVAEGDNIPKLAEVQLADLEAKGDPEALLAWALRRAQEPRFLAALGNRDALYALLAELDLDIQRAKGYEPREDGSKRLSYVDVREATLRYRTVFEHLALLNSRLDTYRALDARAALASSTLREQRERESGTFITYDRDTIGGLVAEGEYESGSPEWHAQRNGGIGGSDVAKVLRVDPTYGSRDHRELLLQKVGLSSGWDSGEMREDVGTAIGRGNAWEEAIRHMYADRHPEVQVAFCKTSWAGRGPLSHRHANFDGLVLDATGEPTGILEIKTGVHSAKWGDPSDGFEGMPENYRNQAIWYAGNAGLRDVTLVALLDDHDYREYHFTMDDPRAVASWAAMEEGTDAFWATVLEERAKVAAGTSSLGRAIPKGFPRTLNMKDAARRVAAYSGEAEDVAYGKVREAFSKVVKDTGVPYTREQIQATLTAVYASHDPALRTAPIVGIDLETNHASPKKGRIIEVGIVGLDPDGTLDVLLSSLYGLPEDVLEGMGTGLEELHGIGRDMVEGLPLFNEPENQARVMSLLDGVVIVAHNATFEREHLAVDLPGFAEGLDEGRIALLDTRQIATNLMVESQDNSLNTFAEDNGVPYVDAHAATADTAMMMMALHNFQTTMHRRGKFVPTPVTDDERTRVEALAQNHGR